MGLSKRVSQNLHLTFFGMGGSIFSRATVELTPSFFGGFCSTYQPHGGDLRIDSLSEATEDALNECCLGSTGADVSLLAVSLEFLVGHLLKLAAV